MGKGLTFDSGGLCIKPAPGMEEMKGDMGGAANVVALMAAVAAVKPDAEVHGIIGCAENMPDGAAYRPGDIFGSYDGKTVEIINTDAEGRLVLADALAYARELKPDLLLDNATLTGAAVVALGLTVSGFYANRDEVADRVKRAAKTAGEALWHMPLVEDLREGLKSDWADIKHVADRWGGSITAALFLREFVGETPWIHVDLAGPSMANKPYNVYAKGGTGHGVLHVPPAHRGLRRAARRGGGSKPPPSPERPRCSMSPLRRKLAKAMARAIADFDMIAEGDRILCAVSGGKDSYALHALLVDLAKRAPVRFEVLAVNIDQGHPGYPGHLLTDYMSAGGHAFRMVAEDTYSIVTDKIPEGQDDITARSAPGSGEASSTASRGSSTAPRSRWATTATTPSPP